MCEIHYKKILGVIGVWRYGEPNGSSETVQ